VPTVFVQDTDVVLQVPQLARPRPLSKARARLYVGVYERMCRRAVAAADLTLMKSGSLERRYRPYAKNLRIFEDTSYLTSEIAPGEIIEERVRTRAMGRPLRFVYCGRLVARKGVAQSVEILARAAQSGARIQFDVIGGGPEEARLVSMIAQAGLSDSVRLVGSARYGPELIARLAHYDALFFTPTAEDTPRMIFDGYAAGLPLIATETDYNAERVRSERAGSILPQGDIEGAARALVALDRDRQSLDEWTRAARSAALYHAADAWYARRADWTHEAIERRVVARSSR
jgi:glycosyltransferase involved in cell wall biosynthesis